MATLLQQLTGHQIIGLDTSLFIYQFEQHPRYQLLANQILQQVESGQLQALFSVVGLMEITVRPWKLGKEGVARKYEALLANFPHLTIVDVTRPVARQAARIRGKYHLRPADALHVASALTGGATAFVTNDRHLGRLDGEVNVYVLDDYG